MPKPRYHVIAALAVTLLLPAQAADTWPFAIATAAFESVPRERLWDGKVEAVMKSTVSAQTSGRVAALPFDVDEFVEAGAVLVRFTDTEQRAALQQAQANVSEARATRLEAVQEYQRIANLYETGNETKRTLDRARAARDQAEARLAAALSAVAGAEQQLEYTVVRAPYAGVVAERHVEIGESVRPGQPLMTGLSLEHLRVLVDLPVHALRAAREAGHVFVIANGERIAATGVTFFPYADPVVSSMQARVDLPTGRYGLFPGMLVKVAFVLDESERLLVPQAALVRRVEMTGVYVVGPGAGEVRLRQVRLGRKFGQKVEVLAGLEAGERVALDPIRAGIYVKTGR